MGYRGPYRRAVLLLAALLVATFSVALNAAPADAFVIGNGAQPSIAVDEEGTAHIVWNEVTGDNQADILHYCQVPRGATACQDEQSFVPPELLPPYNKETARARVVLPGPDQVEILTDRYPGQVTVDGQGNPNDTLCDNPLVFSGCDTEDSNTWVWRSQDDGQTFGSPMVFSHASPSGDAQVFYTPTPVVGTISDTVTGGTYFASAAPGGYDRSSINLGNGGPDQAYNGTLAALRDATPVAAFSDLHDNIDVRVHNGGNPATFNDITTWGPSQTLRGDEPRLAGGPSGVWLMYRPLSSTGATQPYSVRPFTGTGFGSPVFQLTNDSGDQFGDVFEDDSGTVHAVWAHHAAAGDQLTYRFDSDDHRVFSSPQVLATAPAGQMNNLGLGAADDGGGFAVYSSDESANSTISLVPFGTSEKRTLIDVGVAGMDVTQGIQDPNFAVRGSNLSVPAVASYTGVKLADRHTTVVRVYATSRRDLAGAAVPTMTLNGYRGGASLGNAILPDAVPTSLPVGAPNLITAAERTSTTLVYTFTLPYSWEQGNVKLVAQINPLGLTPSVAECRLCRVDNTFELDNIDFNPTITVHMLPVAIKTNGELPNGYPNDTAIFSGVRAANPLAFDIPGYLGTLDMSDIASSTTVTVEKCFLGIWPCKTDHEPITQSERLGFALDRLSDWASDHSTSVYPIGVFRDDSTLGGITTGIGGVYSVPALFGGAGQALSIVRDDRPLTSVAHEIGHGLGRVHAGLTCGSNSNDQVGEAWPPNNDGALDGVGLDTRLAPPYAVLQGGASGQPPTYYDLMSYCANTNESTAGGNQPDAWVSLRNWQRYLATGGPKSNVVRAAAAGSSVPQPNARLLTARVASADPANPRSLRVVAVVPQDGPAGVVEVAPDDGAPTPVDPNETYTLVARGVGGKVLGTWGAVPQTEHVEHGLPVLLLSGRVPAAGVKGIEVMNGTQPVTGQLGSAHAPVVRISAPAARAVVGAHGGKVVIRWRATDADPGSKLTSIVQYSTNDGGTFHTLWIGANRSSLALPVSMFVGSHRARIRVRVQDGFHETMATSARFTAIGGPPIVQLIAPVAGTKLHAGASVDLIGEANNPAGQALRGQALTWTTGKTVLEHGAQITTVGLAPGRHRITLTAKSGGRAASASVVVQVLPAKALFTVLRAPGRVSVKAKSVTLSLAAIYTAPLTIGRVHVTVGAKVTRVKVAIKRGHSELKLTLKLGSGRFASKQTVLIARG